MSRKKSVVFIVASGLLVLWLTVVSSAFAASKEKVLYSFCAQQLCPDGSNPVSSLIFDRAGNLYGTASYGGNSNCTHGCGTVFELMKVKGKWKQKVLHHFENNGSDGYYPGAGLIFDSAGNLYGTTIEGGAVGTVFELMPQKNGRWKEKVLQSFDFADGSGPEAAVVFGADGNLYGTTIEGGASHCDDIGCGTLFELKPQSHGTWSEKVLHNFGSGNDGVGPRAPLIFDAGGNLYSTTVIGGPGSDGTVFEITRAKKGAWKEKVLYGFTGGSDGGLSEGGVVFDPAGSLYGTTLVGGNTQCGGCGTVFKLTPGAKGKWTLTTLHSFDTTDGAFPGVGVIVDAAGNLYGATEGGGAYNSACNYPGCGTVFELTKGSGGTWTETVLHSFNSNGVDGYQPYGGLIRDAAGNLYGTTYSGGAYGYGTVFEVTP
jgi:uncharacterized repeat protein (TIGR03803 family)